jgi:peptidoglycan/LPS O-acetylase OafA/YrhL
MAGQGGAERIVFAEALRGVAALLVLASHALGTFWAHALTMGDRLGVARLEPAPTPPSPLLAEYRFVVGELGVGIFFLISGYVIALAVERSGPGAFFARRLWRIFPVWIAGFSVTLGVIVAVGAAFGGAFPYTAKDVVLGYLLLPREWFGGAVIDGGVAWTLEIELLFYLMMAVCGRWILAGGAARLWLAAAGTAILAAIVQEATGNGWYGRQIGALPLLLAGVGFVQHERGRVRIMTPVALCLFALAVTYGLFVADRRLAALADHWVAGYAMACVVFGVCHAKRARFAMTPIFAHLAAISYPLYASHALVVFGGLYVATRLGAPAWGAIGLVLLASWAVAIALHHLVERPALAMARRAAPAPRPPLEPAGGT